MISHPAAIPPAQAHNSTQAQIPMAPVVVANITSLPTLTTSLLTPKSMKKQTTLASYNPPPHDCPAWCHWCCVICIAVIVLVVIFSIVGTYVEISDTVNTKHDVDGYKFQQIYLELKQTSACIISNKMKQDRITVYYRRTATRSFYFTLLHQNVSTPADHVFLESKTKNISSTLKPYQHLYDTLRLSSNWSSLMNKHQSTT